MSQEKPAPKFGQIPPQDASRQLVKAATRPDSTPAALTDGQITALCAEIGFTAWSEWDGGEYQAMWTELVRRVEQAHGIYPKP